MTDLKQKIKQLIIDSLGLEDLTPADIGDEEALFGDSGLGLDSVDALELQELRDSFANVSTLAAFVQKHRA